SSDVCSSDLLGDLVTLLRADHWACGGLTISARAKHELADPLGHRGGEFLGERLVNQDAVGGDAHLSRTPHLRINGSVHGLVHVRVLEDNERGVATQLQGGADGARRGLRCERLTYPGGTGEGELA